MLIWRIFFVSRILYQDISIGKNLRKLRIQAGLSQEEVAVRLQVQGVTISREIISQMERGLHGIKISTLIELKKLYRVDTFDDFFCDLEE